MMLDALRESLYQEDMLLIRKAFQDHGCPDDDAIRRIAHRVVHQCFKDGAQTWRLDGVIVLRIGPPEFIESKETGCHTLRVNRSVAFA